MNKVIKICFICHGNICRSPMAEFVMKDLVKKAHLEDRFEIASAATSTEEIWGGRELSGGVWFIDLDQFPSISISESP